MKPSKSKYTDLEIFRRLMLMAKPYWKNLTGIFALELLAIPLILLLPIPVKIAVDSVIGNSPLPVFLKFVIPDNITHSKTSLLWLAVILQVLFVLLSRIVNMLGYMMQVVTGENLKLNFRRQLFRHVQRLSFTFHDTRGTSDSIFRIQYNAPAIQYITLNALIPIVSSFLKLAGMIYVISIINIQLALVAISVIPFLYFLAAYYNKKMRPRYNRIQQLESQSLGIIQEVMTSFRVVKAFGREESEQERFTAQSNETLRNKCKLSFSEGLFGTLVNMVTAIGTALVIFIGVSQVTSESITLGELLMVLTYLTQLYSPLQSISQQATSLQSSFASAHRALELLDETPDVIEKPHAKTLKRAQGHIRYANVSFAYDGANNVLKDINLDVKPGQLVGIRGKTGAGKSTMISLLPRFYDLTSGSILLDGVDIRDYKLQDLRNQFAIVLQEPVLFSTTIAENILYAKPGAHRDDVIKAAQAANAHDFIMVLPDQYETMVGERGMRLSGGERQRISLARAFLKDAPILILDEPTSSVDTKTETLIMDAMNRLMQNRTTLMIAHRLSTLDKCHVKIEIENGRIISNLHSTIT